MSPEQRTRALAARFAAVEWLDDELRAPSRAALMSEYLRRAALWAQALDNRRLWPFFDIAKLIDSSVRADAELVRAVGTDILKRGGNYLDQRSAEYALHFAALPSTGRDLPDPFEPLLELYERGGQFHQEAGLIYFSLMGVKVGSMDDHLSPDPVAGVDTAAMDAADAVWRRRFERPGPARGPA